MDFVVIIVNGGNEFVIGILGDCLDVFIVFEYDWFVFF